MHWVCFYLDHDVDVIAIEHELSELGLVNIACIEEPEEKRIRIFGSSVVPFWAEKLPSFVRYYEAILDPEINWQSEWESSPYFDPETAQLDLRHFGIHLEEPFLKMVPGPGFGDLSHPTTQLMLEMSLPYVEGEVIVDIGCGSGVLALAALKAGAYGAYAIDISKEALEHTRQNAALNGLEKSLELSESLPEVCYIKTPILFMNMISSEQEFLWKHILEGLFAPCKIFTSGILIEDEEAYISLCRSRGLELIEKKERQGWAGFHFFLKPASNYA